MVLVVLRSLLLRLLLLLIRSLSSPGVGLLTWALPLLLLLLRVLLILLLLLERDGLVAAVLVHVVGWALVLLLLALVLGLVTLVASWNIAWLRILGVLVSWRLVSVGLGVSSLAFLSLILLVVASVVLLVLPLIVVVRPLASSSCLLILGVLSGVIVLILRLTWQGLLVPGMAVLEVPSMLACSAISILLDQASFNVEDLLDHLDA